MEAVLRGSAGLVLLDVSPPSCGEWSCLSSSAPLRSWFSPVLFPAAGGAGRAVLLPSRAGILGGIPGLSLLEARGRRVLTSGTSAVHPRPERCRMRAGVLFPDLFSFVVGFIPGLRLRGLPLSGWDCAMGHSRTCGCAWRPASGEENVLLVHPPRVRGGALDAGRGAVTGLAHPRARAGGGFWFIPAGVARAGSSPP